MFVESDINIALFRHTDTLHTHTHTHTHTHANYSYDYTL